MKHLKNKRFLTPKSIKHAITNCNGSEAVEMVYSAAVLMVMIMTALMILTYALQVNRVSYAAKLIARSIEVGGTANQTEMDNLLDSALPNHEDLDATVVVPDSSVTYFNPGNKEIQLRQKFQVVVTAKYKLTLMANPGFGSDDVIQYDLPIRVSVNGQSEVYWKDT